MVEGEQDGAAVSETREYEDTAARRARTGARAALVLTIVAPALLVWAWSRPAPAPPREVPPLVLDPHEVDAVRMSDATLSTAAPEGERASERRRLYREVNAAERLGTDPPGRGEARRLELERALADLVEAHGDEARATTRASDLGRLDHALRGEVSDAQRDADIGGFVAMMSRYELLRDGRQVAPRFVVRTLFAARWNVMHGLELTDGFSDAERRAYWGWLALRAESAPLELRLDALERYAEVGGSHVEEARGVLLYDAGRMDEAAEAFERAYAEIPTFRLRNHALACREALAGEGSDEPNGP